MSTLTGAYLAALLSEPYSQSHDILMAKMLESGGCSCQDTSERKTSTKYHGNFTGAPRASRTVSVLLIIDSFSVLNSAGGMNGVPLKLHFVFQ